jgi:hypothetical protein
VTKEEQQAVLQALFKADPRLASPGFTGHGHINRCPNGHIYVIGDCGGAVMTARCHECGATIGGTGHALAEGNVPAPVAELAD